MSCPAPAAPAATLAPVQIVLKPAAAIWALSLMKILLALLSTVKVLPSLAKTCQDYIYRLFNIYTLRSKASSIFQVGSMASDSAKWFKLLVLCSAMMYVIQSSMSKSKEQCMSAGFYM